VRFEHRDGWTTGRVSLDLRVHADIEDDGTFVVPESYRHASMLQRLIDAGHKPVTPEELPPSVDYDYDTSDTDSDTDADDVGEQGDEADAEAEPEDVDEVTGDEGAGDEDDAGDGPNDGLAEMDRADLYQLAKEDLGLEVEWTGSTKDDLAAAIRAEREKEGD
jgi:hypothetical protein